LLIVVCWLYGTIQIIHSFLFLPLLCFLIPSFPQGSVNSTNFHTFFLLGVCWYIELCDKTYRALFSSNALIVDCHGFLRCPSDKEWRCKLKESKLKNSFSPRCVWSVNNVMWIINEHESRSLTWGKSRVYTIHLRSSMLLNILSIVVCLDVVIMWCRNVLLLSVMMKVALCFVLWFHFISFKLPLHTIDLMNCFWWNMNDWRGVIWIWWCYCGCCFWCDWKHDSLFGGKSSTKMVDCVYVNKLVLLGFFLAVFYTPISSSFDSVCRGVVSCSTLNNSIKRGWFGFLD